MQLHELRPENKIKKKKRVGRGGKRGTYSGRGIKGQKARAGRRIRPALRDIIKKLPKKRGYRAKVKPRSTAVVNLELLEKKFEMNSEISPRTLFEAGLVRKISGKIPQVKILGRGKITKSFVVKDCFFSKSAEDAIKKAGGQIWKNSG